MRVSEPSLGGDQGSYKETTCTIRPGWLTEHGSYKSRTHTVEDLSGSLPPLGFSLLGLHMGMKVIW